MKRLVRILLPSLCWLSAALAETPNRLRNSFLMIAQFLRFQFPPTV